MAYWISVESERVAVGRAVRWPDAEGQRCADSGRSPVRWHDVCSGVERCWPIDDRGDGGAAAAAGIVAWHAAAAVAAGVGAAGGRLVEPAGRQPVACAWAACAWSGG